MLWSGVSSLGAVCADTSISLHGCAGTMPYSVYHGESLGDLGGDSGAVDCISQLSLPQATEIPH